jgi:hypothetical protein
MGLLWRSPIRSFSMQTVELQSAGARQLLATIRSSVNSCIPRVIRAKNRGRGVATSPLGVLPEATSGSYKNKDNRALVIR